MNNFEYEIHNVYSDSQGNYCIIDIVIEKKTRLTLVNIYGPNIDSPVFYKQIENKIHELGNSKIMIFGDFNLVLDAKKDTYNYKHINNPHARKMVLDIMEKMTYQILLEF